MDKQNNDKTTPVENNELLLTKQLPKTLTPNKDNDETYFTLFDNNRLGIQKQVK